MKIYKSVLLIGLAVPFSAFSDDAQQPSQPQPTQTTQPSQTTTQPSQTTTQPSQTTTQPSQPSQPTTQSSANDISGTYVCSGYDPFNKTNYSFPTVVISKKDNVFNVQWQDNSGNPIMLGNAVANPSLGNAYAFIYWPTKPDYYLVGLYIKNADGSLQSNWMEAGQTLVGTETCTKTK